MRVWISIDMEGMSGIVERRQLIPGQDQYERGRMALMQDLDAVLTELRGAPDLDGEIVVNDSHDGMLNVLWDRIPPGVRLISGGTKALSMNQGVQHADLALFVGYHAMAGTPAAIMDHTYSGEIFRVTLNGREVGETGINAAVAGHYGVPVGLVSGDDKLAHEVAALLPGAVTVIVKEGVSRNSAGLLSSHETTQRLREGVAEALARARTGSLRPYKVDAPTHWTMTLMTADMADRAMYCPGTERIDGRTVAFTTDTVLEGFRAFYTVMGLASGRPIY